MNNKLFVANLPRTTTQQELERLFAVHGLVAEVKLPFDHETGRRRSFAFITMGTPEAAQTAIQALNGHVVAERALAVSEARPRPEKPSFNRSGTERQQENDRHRRNGRGF